ncbi:1,4-beta-xylanase [Pedobacter psychrophilus]|uniref:1,4-beta-xylanase n=1 Tax=Pedobacter psychrophilus TaxID=1826909 RepID=A0A179DHA3_9SPHI|nr:alpha/beta hydrolase [Pedobacter psychrophilus]OAQ40457.1 1,4-beta-xylanase [Pedobacter psychrophilus]
MKKLLIIFFLIFMFGKTEAQQIMDLYSGEVPNSKTNSDYIERSDTSKADGKIRVSKVSKPQLIAFYPEKGKANGTSVIICPGGGYAILAIAHEGYDIAKEFNKYGVTAFVLKYRLPSDDIMIDKAIGPLQDAQQATKMVKENALTWNLDTAKIGIMGFSAGGHLASTLETHYKKSLVDNPKKTNLRPDFAILGYPVVTMGKFGHKGSRENLLGKTAAQDQIDYYSNELQVNQNTPPTFIFQANDDKSVPSENSLDLTKALKQAGVKVELHLYQNGGHGYGLINPTTKESWFVTMINWMKENKFL